MNKRTVMELAHYFTDGQMVVAAGGLARSRNADALAVSDRYFALRSFFGVHGYPTLEEAAAAIAKKLNEEDK